MSSGEREGSTWRSAERAQDVRQGYRDEPPAVSRVGYVAPRAQLELREQVSDGSQALRGRRATDVAEDPGPPFFVVDDVDAVIGGVGHRLTCLHDEPFLLHVGVLGGTQGAEETQVQQSVGQLVASFH